MVKTTNYRELDAAAIEQQLQEAQEQLFRLRFQIGMGQTEGVKKYRLLRKDRARMLTALTQKQGNGDAAAAEVKATAAESKKKAKKAE